MADYSIYKVTIRDADSPRLVKARTAAEARSFVAEARTVTAIELAELMGKGATIEEATAASAEDMIASEAERVAGKSETK